MIDTGVGIPYDKQDCLFKLFGFVKDSGLKNTSGIGLGLVIPENIVNMFEGKIDYHSVPDVGSTFTFTFKLNDVQ